MKIELINVGIRRDITATINTTVPAHEVPVLAMVFGENAIIISDEGTGVTFDVENPSDEMSRLRSKYGKDKDAKRYFVDMIYVGTPALIAQLKNLEVKEVAPATTKKTKSNAAKPVADITQNDTDAGQGVSDEVTV